MPTIHSVNRFIPFLFALFCVSVFSLPGYAYASDIYKNGASASSNGTSQGTYISGSGEGPAWLNIQPPSDWIGITSIGTPMFLSYAGVPYDHIGGSIKLKVYTTTDGVTPDTLVATSQDITDTEFYTALQVSYPSSYNPMEDAGYVKFPFTSAFDMNNGTQYVLVFESTSLTCSNTFNGVTDCASYTRVINYQNSTTDQGTIQNVIISGTVASLKPAYLWVEGGGGGDSCDSGVSRICGFTPENGTTVTGPNIDFTLDYFVTQEDIDQNLNDVVITLHNIDQNVLLLGFLSPGDIVLYNEVATTSAHISFATTTALADGNYRIQAKMQRKFFFDWITIPGDNINQTISKQFVVGSSTFIGNLTQNGFNILNGTLASSTATSSVALVANCNPLGTFDMVNCLAGLFIPDAGQVQATIQGAQEGILTRMPWGYVTRFVGIVGGTGTTTLSTTYTATVAMNTASDTTELSFNPGDMFAGGATLVDSIESPYDSSVTFRSVFEPIIKLSIAVMVVLTIFSDITGSHAHHTEQPGDTRRRRV